MVGTFHEMSTTHIHCYVAEFTCRFNSRRNGSLFDEVLADAMGARLSWCELTNTDAQQT